MDIQKEFDLLARDFDLKEADKGAPQHIIDTRSAASFQDIRPSSETLSQNGHIPGSVNIPYGQVTDPDRQTLLSRLFESTAVDVSRPLVCGWGSGVSAAVSALALYRLSLPIVPVYDCSWAEWGSRPNRPKRTGQ